MQESTNPLLTRYISEAQRYPTLERDAERTLIEAWQKTGDAKASEALIRANLRHVVAIALKYKRYGVPVSELIAEGNFGLMHALGKFNPALGHRFVTYAAYWIRAYVLGYVLKTWSLVGGGSGALRSKVFFKLRRERVKLMNLTGDREQAEKQLAERLGVTPAALQDMLQRLESRDLSLDVKVFDDSPSELIDRIAPSNSTQEDTTIHNELVRGLKKDVRDAMTLLDERERYIVEQRLLADPEDELSLAEIGRKLGVSRERARQLEERAKGKLRRELEDRTAVTELVANGSPRLRSEIPPSRERHCA
ncbi:MAG TPA: sigma-70 family RNA polymerase sigma factor [Polyangiaceae bacterium]|nr:sigma-70 family RNA polymerase sigma factor [Polyangiaceae bacterium]